VKGADGVNIALIEIDKNTGSVRATIEGEDIDPNHVVTTMKDCGAVIHSVDEVAVEEDSWKRPPPGEQNTTRGHGRPAPQRGQKVKA